MILSKLINIWDKVFKNGPSKICGSQPLKNLRGYGLLLYILPENMKKNKVFQVISGGIELN